MESTHRLYFTNSSLLDFTAEVTAVRTIEAGEAIILDQTAFYPTGGGQPHDQGRLDDAQVIDVIEEDDGSILHLVNEPGLFKSGQRVQGIVNAARRMDHLQQHSGQHLLSQAFIKACGAETRSFHLGIRSSTIDIEMDSPDEAKMRITEDLANQIVFEDRTMRIHLVNESEAASLPLRKESAVRGDIRVIEIEDFDWSPCGGTHAARTGQIGLIAIKSYERAKKMTRVEFVCGRRALEEYRLAHRTAVTTARLFSADRDSAPELVSRTLDENKSLKKRVRELLEIAIKIEASDLLMQTPQQDGIKLVRISFTNRDPEEIRILANKIAESGSSVALLGTSDREGAKLVFARSADLNQHLGKLLSEACLIIGGRGGGRPDLAQGGGPLSDKLEEALSLAERTIRENKGQ